MKIAIDGPGGSGKSALAKNLARNLGLIYVDTGALYRTIGLYISQRGIDKNDIKSIISVLYNIKIELIYIDGAQHVLLSGDDVSDKIRTPDISMYASAVSAIPEVREFLLTLQRDYAMRGNVVMDGRDIGTVIMPDADVKIFLFASPRDRAQRRYEELINKGNDVLFDDVLSDIIKRDEADRTRSTSPAVPAADAVMLDNSGFYEADTYTAAIKIINDKTGASYSDVL